MDENKKTVQAPDFSNEEMKMPENAVLQTHTRSESTSVINGPLLAFLTILLVLLLAGMYYWFATLPKPEAVVPAPARPTVEQNNEPESTTAEAQVETTQAVSPSDELSAIEADLEATDLDSLDSELQAIDTEIDNAATAQ